MSSPLDSRLGGHICKMLREEVEEPQIPPRELLSAHSDLLRAAQAARKLICSYNILFNVFPLTSLANS